MKVRPLALPLVLLAFWAAVSGLGLTSRLLVPAPWEVGRVAVSPAYWRSVAPDLAATCARLAAGFALGGTCGVILGIAMGHSKRLYELLVFPVDFFRSIPVAALFPLFLVLFGVGNLSKIATVMWSTGLIVLVNTMYGVRVCSPTRQRFARTLHASALQLLRTVVIPESLPSILGGLRTGLSIALIVVILTEMFLGTERGLGQRIFRSALLYETAAMYLSIILTGILGYGLNRAFVVVERRMLRCLDDSA